jgi:phytoene synthase
VARLALAPGGGVTEALSARLTRQSGTNFYYAFRILPREKRDAIYALYSFCRLVDDCVDDERGEGAAGLDRWLEEVGLCYGGEPRTELGRELARAVARFPIPRACFEDIVAGCRMDLTVRRYPTFEALREYCRRVASAVGLATIEIFGYRNRATRDYAVELGLALQLTNILRDVATDAARDRLYIPLEDLVRFGVGEAELLAAAASGAPHTKERAALLAFEADRARERYARAQALLPAEDRRAMVSAQIMGAIYRAILEELARRGYPLRLPRVGLSRSRKAWIALRTLAATLAA